MTARILVHKDGNASPKAYSVLVVRVRSAGGLSDLL